MYCTYSRIPHLFLNVFLHAFNAFFILSSVYRPVSQLLSVYTWLPEWWNFLLNKTIVHFCWRLHLNHFVLPMESSLSRFHLVILIVVSQLSKFCQVCQVRVYILYMSGFGGKSSMWKLTITLYFFWNSNLIMTIRILLSFKSYQWKSLLMIVYNIPNCVPNLALLRSCWSP